MNYKQKAKELKEITKELRLLNPLKREYQLKHDKCSKDLVSIVMDLSSGKITRLEAVYKTIYVVMEARQPIKTGEFASGGIILNNNK